MEQLRAAALACPGAVVSHRSAAALLGIGEVAPVVVDVIPSEQRGRKIDGIKAHRVVFPARHELVRVYGIACTNVARTAVDLAGVYGEDGLRKAFERAAAAGKLDLATIETALASRPRKHVTWRQVEREAPRVFAVIRGELERRRSAQSLPPPPPAARSC